MVQLLSEHVFLVQVGPSVSRERDWLQVVWMCRPVFGEVPLAVYYFCCSVDLSFKLKFSYQPCNSQQIVKSVLETACKPFQEGIHYPAETFQKAINYPLANSKGWLIAGCNKPNLHAAIHYLFTIIRNVSTSFLKMRKNN